MMLFTSDSSSKVWIVSTYNAILHLAIFDREIDLMQRENAKIEEQTDISSIEVIRLSCLSGIDGTLISIISWTYM